MASLLIMLRLIRLPQLLILLLVATACVTDRDAVLLGVQPDHAGYVPAAIAILPCQAWPAGARFMELPLTSAKDQDVQALCGAFDQAVLKAFDGQPYMRGFSPKFVAQNLEAAGQKDALTKLPQLFAHGPDACDGCATIPDYFERGLAPRPELRAWLADVSRAVRNADAVLLPFVAYAYEKRLNDRGLHVAMRAVGVSLLLVDTGRGELLWAGGREASVPNQRLEAAKVHVELPLPPWEAVGERLYTEQLWRDFPGRQIY